MAMHTFVSIRLKRLVRKTYEVESMHWKKAIAAGALGALMAGSTLGFAQALDNLPAPFVQDSTVNMLVVVGANAATSDVVGAIDFAGRFGGAPVTKETVSVPGVSGVVQAVGEGREIGTKTEQIFLGTNLATAGLRTTMTDADLPNLLASGTVQDTDANDEYDFDQFITFSNDFPLVYSRVSGEEADPSYKFGEFGTSASATNNFYKTSIVFTDEVNTTTVVSEDIVVFGGKYTFSPDTSKTCAGTPKVALFGSSDTRTLREGESVTVTIDGVTHTITLITVSDADTVAVSVDGTSKSLDKGQSTTISGVSIFVDDVFFSSKETVTSSAELGLGAREITLTDGSQVEVGVGGNTDFIDGSLVDLTCSSGKLTQIDVYVTAGDSKGDFLKEGGTYVDPVYGSFSVALPTVLPAINDPSRDLISISPSGDNDIDIRFENDRGNTATVKWAHRLGDDNLILADDNSDEIIVAEGAFIDRDDYFVVDSGDFSRMFEVTGASSLGTADSEVRIRDVFSGDTIEVKLGTDNAVNKVIDGQEYFFNVTGSSADDLNLVVTWGSGASTQHSFDAKRPDVGDYWTVYPKLESRADAEIAFMEAVNLNLSANTVQLIQLPTGAVEAAVEVTAQGVTLRQNITEDSKDSVLSSAIAGSLSNSTAGVFRLGQTSTGGAVYNFSWVDNGLQGTLTIRPVSDIDSSPGTAATSNPTVLLIEEEDDDGDIAAIAIEGDDDTSDDETEVGAPSFSNVGGASSFSGTREADTDVTWYVDEWGTWVSRDTEDQARVEIKYPDEQVSAAVFVLGKGASTTTTGGAGTVTSEKVVPIKSAIAKLDREVTDADKTNKNFVLIGGPAVNSLVADLATAGKTWNRGKYIEEGEGTAIIQVVADAFATGKVALIAAGHSAADTRTATSILQRYDDYEELTGAGVKIKNGAIVGAL